MKHRYYNGVQIVLVASDGNLQNRDAAVALAPMEDHSAYSWFYSRILQCGFQLNQWPVFSDRHAGIISASSELGVINMYCTRHLIGKWLHASSAITEHTLTARESANTRADKKSKLAVANEGIVWRAQAAVTKANYDSAIDDLDAVNHAAAKYLRALQPEKWALFPHYDSRLLYGWRTTNFVESEQARALRLKPRLMLPYEFFRPYATIMTSEAFRRQEQGDKWLHEGRIVTPRAEIKFQCELKQSAFYTVAFSSPTVAYAARLSHPTKQRRVDIASPTCTYSTWLQHGVVCRHILAGHRGKGHLDGAISLMAGWYTVAQYMQDQRPVELPEDTQLTQDSSLLPARVHRQAGRPRKRRIRSRGETSATQRVRKAFRCERCGVADGHNSRTCRALL